MEYDRKAGIHMKTFIQEFKEFITRGNVMDLAIGVIIGGSFKAIVDSLVNDMLMPVIGGLTGNVDLSALSVHLRSVELKYGLFLNAVINFLIIAFVIFTTIKIMAKARLKQTEKEGESTPEDIALLREIRDSLKKD